MKCHVILIVVLIYLAMKPSSFDLKCNLDVLWFVECRILLTLFLNYFLYFLSLQFCIFNFFWYTATSNLESWDLILNHHFIIILEVDAEIGFVSKFEYTPQLKDDNKQLTCQYTPQRCVFNKISSGCLS